MKDVSHALAIIRRAVTDYEIGVENQLEHTFKKADPKSKKSFYKFVESAADLEFKHSLIVKLIEVKSLTKRRKITYFYFDLYSAYKHRLAEKRLPEYFDIRVRYFDNKIAPQLLDDNSDLNFLRVRLHCVQRVIQRGRAESFSEAIKLFSPICYNLFYIASTIIGSSLRGRYAIVWKEGYFILDVNESGKSEIVTWLPTNLMNPIKLNKIKNIISYKEDRVFLYTSKYFNSNDTLEIGEEVNSMELVRFY